MGIGVEILVLRPVQTFKVLFNKQVHTRLRWGLDADLIAFHPLRHLERGDIQLNLASVESNGDRLG